MNELLTKLTNYVNGIENEKEMLIRLIIGLSVFLLCTIFRKQIAGFIVTVITKTFARKSPNAQRSLKNSLVKPLSFLIFVLSVFIGTEIIIPSGQIRKPVLVFVKLGLILFVTWFSISFINSDFSFVLKNDDSKTKKTAVNFLSNLLKIIIIVIATLLMLEQFGISATRVFAALGIGGVAVAFACKDAVENLLSGFIIIYDKPFEVDDFVKIDSETGQVQEIKIRTTRLQMLDGSQKIYPNTTVANASIVNLSRMEQRLVNETLCLDYKHSANEIKNFCRDLKQLILNYDEVIKDDVRVNFVKYGSSALEIEVYFYVAIPTVPEYFEFKNKFNCDVKAFADSKNIEFAFTSNSLYFANELSVKK